MNLVGYEQKRGKSIHLVKNTLSKEERYAWGVSTRYEALLKYLEAGGSVSAEESYDIPDVLKYSIEAEGLPCYTITKTEYDFFNHLKEEGVTALGIHLDNIIREEIESCKKDFDEKERKRKNSESLHRREAKMKEKKAADKEKYRTALSELDYLRNVSFKSVVRKAIDISIKDINKFNEGGLSTLHHLVTEEEVTTPEQFISYCEDIVLLHLYDVKLAINLLDVTYNYIEIDKTPHLVNGLRLVVYLALKELVGYTEQEHTNRTKARIKAYIEGKPFEIKEVKEFNDTDFYMVVPASDRGRKKDIGRYREIAGAPFYISKKGNNYYATEYYTGVGAGNATTLKQLDEVIQKHIDSGKLQSVVLTTLSNTGIAPNKYEGQDTEYVQFSKDVVPVNCTKLTINGIPCFYIPTYYGYLLFIEGRPTYYITGSTVEDITNKLIKSVELSGKTVEDYVAMVRSTKTSPRQLDKDTYHTLRNEWLNGVRKGVDGNVVE